MTRCCGQCVILLNYCQSGFEWLACWSQQWVVTGEILPPTPETAKLASISGSNFFITTLIARFMGPTWGPSGADRTQVGPMSAPWIDRHCENFWAFTGPRRDFGLILLISNMIIYRSFTGPTHLLSVNVRGPVSFAVSEYIVTKTAPVHTDLPLRGPGYVWLVGNQQANDKMQQHCHQHRDQWVYPRTSEGHALDPAVWNTAKMCNYEVLYFSMKYRNYIHLCYVFPCILNPLRAKFFRGNINLYLHFVSFLHIDTMQVVEILPQVRQEPTYST